MTNSLKIGDYFNKLLDSIRLEKSKSKDLIDCAIPNSISKAIEKCYDE